MVAPSLTVKVTGCAPSASSVPAAGLCVMKSGPQLSVARICERSSGSTTVQLLPALKLRLLAHCVITGALVSRTVTVAVQVAWLAQGSAAVNEIGRAHV